MILGGDICDGYMFLNAWVILGGDICDGRIVHRFHELRVMDEQDEEEEHLAPADPSAIPTDDPLHTISSCFLRPNPVQYGCLFNTILYDHHLLRTRGSRMVGSFKMLEQVELIAYKLGLPQELSRVHNTFHVSYLRKYYADEPLAVPLDELHFDDKLRFVEKPTEIMDREVKWLRQSRVPIVKVRWNSRRGPEFT
ncbi:hypothetical protein Tco_1321529 [Tanacetum coccineum]